MVLLFAQFKQRVIKLIVIDNHVFDDNLSCILLLLLNLIHGSFLLIECEYLFRCFEKVVRSDLVRTSSFN